MDIDPNSITAAAADVIRAIDGVFYPVHDRTCEEIANLVDNACGGSTPDPELVEHARRVLSSIQRAEAWIAEAVRQRIAGPDEGAAGAVRAALERISGSPALALGHRRVRRVGVARGR